MLCSTSLLGLSLFNLNYEYNTWSHFNVDATPPLFLKTDFNVLRFYQLVSDCSFAIALIKFLIFDIIFTLKGIGAPYDIYFYKIYFVKPWYWIALGPMKQVLK